MANELSEGMRGLIIALSYEGMSQRKIADEVKVSKGTVQRTLKRFQETGSYSTKPKLWSPRATALREGQYIKTTSSVRNRTAKAGNIQAIVNCTTRKKSVSRSRGKRILVEHSVNGRVAVWKR